VVLIHNLDSQIRINSKVETFRYEPSDSSKEILGYLSILEDFEIISGSAPFNVLMLFANISSNVLSRYYT
jgi:hypothetical protein